LTRGVPSGLGESLQKNLLLMRDVTVAQCASGGTRRVVLVEMLCDGTGRFALKVDVPSLAIDPRVRRNS